MDLNFITYYQKRASEYDKVYEKPERQEELDKWKSHLSNSVSSKHILEIGCGTGYWTQVLAESASSIVATDINESMLEIARSKSYRTMPIFRQRDYHKLPIGEKRFELIFAGFVISHIRRENLRDFVLGLRKLLIDGGELILMDNVYVEGSSTAISKTDAQGNTFQKRILQDGSEFEILKNFYSEADWKQAQDDWINVKYERGTYFFLSSWRK